MIKKIVLFTLILSLTSCGSDNIDNKKETGNVEQPVSENVSGNKLKAAGGEITSAGTDTTSVVESNTNFSN